MCNYSSLESKENLMFKELKDIPSQTGSFEIKNTEIMQVCQIPSGKKEKEVGDKDNWVDTKYFDLCRVALSKVNTELSKTNTPLPPHLTFCVLKYRKHIRWMKNRLLIPHAVRKRNPS